MSTNQRRYDDDTRLSDDIRGTQRKSKYIKILQKD